MTEGVVAVSVTEAGRRLAASLPYEHVHGHAATTVRARWGSARAFVLFCATGAAVRIVAPLLEDKRSDPAVLSVDDAGRHVVALCGGHAGGANALAREVAALLGAEPVITTASDTQGLAALDILPGLAAHGDLSRVGAALLDGRAVHVDNPLGWPLPRPLRSAELTAATDAGSTAAPAGSTAADAGSTAADAGSTAAEAGSTAAPAGSTETRVVITHEQVVDAPATVVLHPACLVVGIGTSSGAPVEEVRELVRRALMEARLAPEAVAEVATLDRKATEPAITALGWPIRTFDAAALSRVAVPTPSTVVSQAVGTPSVSEAAALAAAGPGAKLLVTKRRSRSATVAVALRKTPRGTLLVVGLGPGSPAHRTPAATAAVRAATVVIGYGPYVDACSDAIAPGVSVLRWPIGAELDRVQAALHAVEAGERVALVCSGDAGIYALASLVMQLAPAGLDIEVIPGITAALAAAALLGAPLGHDHASVSLSDLLTPWSVIERRLEAVAAADLVVSLYNPRSNARSWQLDAARKILLGYRPGSTPVGVVTDATRPSQRVELTTLADLDTSSISTISTIGMTTCVVVGSSRTQIRNGRMYTPRGYES